MSLHEQSHGKSFFAHFGNRFRDHRLDLMDEPEAALPPKRQLDFLGLVPDYVRRDGQFAIAMHSPIIMAYPEARIDRLKGEVVREVASTETDHDLISRGS